MHSRSDTGRKGNQNVYFQPGNDYFNNLLVKLAVKKSCSPSLRIYLG